MQLPLSDHETRLLHQVLESYLEDLRGETVDTDDPDEHREERDALVAICSRLEHSAAVATSPSAITKMVRVTAVLTEYD